MKQTLFASVVGLLMVTTTGNKSYAQWVNDNKLGPDSDPSIKVPDDVRMTSQPLTPLESHHERIASYMRVRFNDKNTVARGGPGSPEYRFINNVSKWKRGSTN